MTGSGTPADPYVIYNVNDLQAMENNLAAYYELANDIDASATVGWNGGLGFEPVGDIIWLLPPAGHPFTGHLDGKGYAISSLFINRPATNDIGLFGAAVGATIQNVEMVSLDVTGDDDVGGLAGSLGGCTISDCDISGVVTLNSTLGGMLAGMIYDSSVVSRCYTHGTISHPVGGIADMGGFFGWAGTGASISRCSSDVTVSGVGAYIGGFGGYCSEVVISQCYCTGDVTSDGQTGGFIVTAAFGNGVTARITNCYSRNNVEGAWGTAGFIYSNGNWLNCTLEIENCYTASVLTDTGAPADRRGFFGHTNLGAVSITGCFWDEDVSRATLDAYATGRTTAQMLSRATFTDAGWDPVNTWGFLRGSYPCLRGVTPGCIGRRTAVQTLAATGVT